jgi:hypothetical protein
MCLHVYVKRRSFLGYGVRVRDSNIFLLAGDEGFEPPITGPEPVALPLGQSPMGGQERNIRIVKRRKLQRVITDVIVSKIIVFFQRFVWGVGGFVVGEGAFGGFGVDRF